MSEFKVGDKVIVLSNKKSGLLKEYIKTEAVVSERYNRSYAPEDALVVRIYDGRYGYVYPEEVVSLEIYNSPLYKALS